MKTNLYKCYVVLVMFLTAVSGSWAQEIEPARGSKPIPSATVIQLSEGTSTTQVVSEHLASWDSTTATPQSDLDLTDDVVKRVRAFIADTRVKNAKKTVIMLAYGVGDPRIRDVLIDAKNAGLGRVVLMMDLARALSPNFETDERFSADFSAAPFTLKSDGTPKDEAVVVKGLLDAGFQYGVGSAGGAPYIISSPPVHNASVVERPPLYHLKGLLLLAEASPEIQAEVESAVISTHNPTLAHRNNRALVLKEPNLIHAFAAGMQAHIETFAQGKRIKEIPPQVPTRVNWGNAFGELRWTDGKYDINFAIAETLVELRKRNRPVLEFYGSWFAATYRPLLEGLRQSMEANPHLEPLIIADDGFSDVTGWGIAPVVAGFDVLSDGTTQMRPFRDALASRARVYIYQRSTLDDKGQIRPQLSEDGPPIDRWVHHDKTTVIKYRDASGRERVRIFVGSMNPSGNYHNAEVQLQFDLDANDPLAKAIIASIQALPISEAQYCVSVEIGMFRNAIGRITGHTDREIDSSLARKVMSALLSRDRGELLGLLRTIANLPSSLKSRPSQEVIDARIERLDRFFEFYFKNIPNSGQGERFRIRRLTQIAILLTHEDLSAFRTRMLVENILWRPSLDREQIKKWVDPVASILVGPLKTLERRERQQDVILTHAAEFRNIEAERIAAAKSGVFSAGALRAHVFDHDDNLMRMVTKIKVFHKQTGEVRAVSTGEWATVRNQIGKPGPWEDFQINMDPMQGSFADFNNEEIITEMKWILENVAPKDWQGWSLLDFYRARVAGNPVWILTARRPSVQTALAAYGVLDDWFEKQTGIKVPALREEQFIGIGGASDPSAAKAQKLLEIADKMEALAAEQEKKNPGQPVQATIGFSDDDGKNASSAIQTLLAEAKRGRWKQLKIVVFKTEGVANYDFPPITVIEPNGTLRPAKGKVEIAATPQPPKPRNIVARALDWVKDGSLAICERYFVKD